MDEFKRMSVWELLMFLQKKVKTNANTIRENNMAINGVESKEKVTPELLQTIKLLTQSNTNLTSENFKFLNLFNALVDFHKNNKQNLIGILENLEFDSERYSEENNLFENYLEKTLNGELELNQDHPYISDVEFLNKLLENWKAEEEYEKCNLVQKILNTNNN